MSKKKKFYNPFKMWGSYAGAVIGLIPNYKFFELVISGDVTNTLESFAVVWLYVSLGFLIGWGIHSLIRRLRK